MFFNIQFNTPSYIIHGVTMEFNYPQASIW